MIEIHKPKWEGNRIRAIGLADYRVALEGNIIEINITYRNKEGLRLYPNPFYIRKTDVVKYPPGNASGTKVYEIPISDLSTTPELNDKYVPYDIKCPKCKQVMRQSMRNLLVSYTCSTCQIKSVIQWEFKEVHAAEIEPLPEATTSEKKTDKHAIIKSSKSDGRQSTFM
jgi:hypothetical protein